MEIKLELSAEQLAVIDGILYNQTLCDNDQIGEININYFGEYRSQDEYITGQVLKDKIHEVRNIIMESLSKKKLQY